jgi:sarcosine oxidase, subunit beta
MTGAGTTVVVGSGVIGASIAAHLARRGGGPVVVCEHDHGLGLGATGRSLGLLRLHHTEASDANLALRSLPTFQRSTELIGGECGYRPCGFALLIGPEQLAAMDRNVARIRSLGGKVDVLDPADFHDRHPGLRLTGVAAVALEPDGGYGDPAALTRCLLRLAVAAGARILDGAHVDRVLLRGDRALGVRTNVGDVAADTVVLAAGAWTASLAAEVGVDLPIEPRRIGAGFNEAARRDGYQVPACIDDTTGTYFRPGDRGLYFGVPCDPAASAEDVLRPLRADEIAAAQTAVAERVPDLVHGRVAGTRVGVDGYTPDKRPVIGPTAVEGLYVAAGMSGGGFKIAPAVGELVAAEIGTGSAHSALAPYRPGRYAAGRPIRPKYPYRWM